MKICHALGIEKQLLPSNFLCNISPSTAHYWKSQNPDSFLGGEYSNLVGADVKDLQLILDRRYRHTKRVFMAMIRLQTTIIQIVGEKHFRSSIRSCRDTFVKVMSQVGETLGGSELVCRVLGVPFGSFKTWKRYQAYWCPTSALSLCFKRIPQQLSYGELSVLRKYLTDKRYLHWSAAAVWGYCYKTGKTAMARATWYQYARLLGLTQARRASRTRKKKPSLRALRPNHTWHMDVSYFKTVDNVQFYVYTVLDNFSRKILAWDVTRELSGRVRVRSLKGAIASEFGVTIGSSGYHPNLELIVDGGSENNNSTIDSFIKSSHVAIDKKVALKDIIFSNSVVEGNFRIMKQSYFRKRTILAETMVAEMEYFVNDYNNHRPHYQHEFYTPAEIHADPTLKNVRPITKAALKDRIAANKKRSCSKKC